VDGAIEILFPRRSGNPFFQLLTSVVAGILPAVEPGILPGGKNGALTRVG
jgi:hypothetical protein